jgi:DNA-binding response OmpR family regulator
VRTPRILVVEDDESLATVLKDALERQGYEVESVADGRVALEKARSGRWSLVLLDLMLPGLDGTEVCRRLRAAGKDVPVLMLTARGREEDRVGGLRAGADDYVVKPFSLRELLARVEARLRGARPTAPHRVRVGDAEVDLEGMVVRRGGSATQLTKMEAGMLRLFLGEPGKVITRARFLDEVWGYDRFPTTRTVDVHVGRLREKLGDLSEPPSVIHTVHGVGYRFDPPPSMFHVVDDEVAPG